MLKKILLFPLSIIYYIIVSLRNKLFKYNLIKSVEFDIPVISIGNITVGGTGKTPHTEYLIRLLKKEFKIAVLSRGYKRKSKGFRIAGVDTPVKEVGDETKQIKEKFSDIIVAVDRKRVNGIRKLCKQYEDLEAILLDDAYQHRYVTPGISILLIDYNRMIYEDNLLPLGELREDYHEKRRANIIIITKCPKSIKPIDQRIIFKRLHIFPYQNLYFSTYKYDKLCPLFKKETQSPAYEIEEFAYRYPTMLLVSGIAKTKVLEDFLNGITKNLHLLRFNDHHYFAPADVKKIEEAFENIDAEKKVIITTEKDAVKLVQLSFSDAIKKRIYVLPAEVEFVSAADKKDFDKEIYNYVKRNKRNSYLLK